MTTIAKAFLPEARLRNDNTGKVASRWIAASLFIAVLTACVPDPPAGSGSPPPSNLPAEQLVELHCGRCHLQPAPGALDKQSWEEGVLPQMGYRMGIYGDTPRESLLESGRAGELMEAAGIFPPKPLLHPEDWKKIRQYYLEKAPEKLPLPPPPAAAPLKQFKASVPEFRIAPPMGTMIKMQKERLFLADAKADYSTLNILGRDFELQQNLALPHPISNLSFAGDSLLVTSMGQFMPTNAPTGSILKVFRPEGNPEYKGFVRLLDNLQRPVHTRYTDLNQDGRKDLLVCEYGNHTGRLAWWEQAPDGSYQPRLLLQQPGASKTIVGDFNDDGLPDILALMAQGDEGVDLYLNLGNGAFGRERLLRFPSTYGSAGLEVLDWNADGHWDILYTNGDNADYSIILKPYHGIRLFLNDGSNHFEEHFFFPLHGAYQTAARDFDRDGDLDLAAVAFFPDAKQHPELGFIYLNNNSDSPENVQFQPYSLPEAAGGRWIAMSAHDFDGDGDEDLALLSFTALQLRDDTRGQYQTWLDESPSFLFLENQEKQ